MNQIQNLLQDEELKALVSKCFSQWVEDKKLESHYYSINEQKSSKLVLRSQCRTSAGDLFEVSLQCANTSIVRVESFVQRGIYRRIANIKVSGLYTKVKQAYVPCVEQQLSHAEFDEKYDPLLQTLVYSNIGRWIHKFCLLKPSMG